MLGERIAPQSEGIRAILLEDSPCCGVTHPRSVRAELMRREGAGRQRRRAARARAGWVSMLLLKNADEAVGPPGSTDLPCGFRSCRV